MVTKQELLEMGARSLLVELKTKELAILKMFPHLDADAIGVTPSTLPKKKTKPKTKHKRTIAKKSLRRSKREPHRRTRFDIIRDLAANMATFTLDDVHRELGGKRQSAANAVFEAKGKGIIKATDEHGVYRRAS